MDENERTLLYGSLADVARQTKATLGEERAACFVYLYNDWLDLGNAVYEAYPDTLIETSLLYADFFAFLGKDILWLHRLLHWGNYPLTYRVLRYDWELIFRANYVDAYQPNIPGDQDVPGPTVDDKAEWLQRRERTLQFSNVIKPILQIVLPDAAYVKRYGQLWGKLNQFVHATHEQRLTLIRDSSTGIRDHFDEESANEVMRDGCQILDLIWVLMLAAFPKLIHHLDAAPDRFRHTPLAQAVAKMDWSQS